MLYQIKIWFKRAVRYCDYLYNYSALPSEQSVIETLPAADDAMDFLRKLAEYLAFNFYYKSDGNIDFAKHPLAFARDKCGDCDDYALFALWALRLKYPGVESYIGTCYNAGEGHAVCIVKVGDLYYHIGNWGLYGGYDTLNALAASIFQGWERFYLLSYNFTVIKSLENKAK